MSALSAALLVLGWLALQVPIAVLLDRLQHPTTTPEEGNR